MQQLIEWNVAHWSNVAGHDVHDEWVSYFHESLTSAPDSLPITLVGTVDGRLVGSVSLVQIDDVPDFTDYSPWVAALMVNPSQRGRGHGGHLLGEIIELARRMDFAALYLWTDAQAPWYERRGWRVIHSIEVHGTPASILTLEL